MFAGVGADREELGEGEVAVGTVDRRDDHPLEARRAAQRIPDPIPAQVGRPRGLLSEAPDDHQVSFPAPFLNNLQLCETK